MKQIAFTWLLCILSICAYAQQITVTGTVTDAENNPLIGAAVVVVGTTDGVITDFDGKYTIKAASGQSLNFSYVGYQEQTVKVDGRSVINVKLSEGELLDEVVVIGMGSFDQFRKKRENDSKEPIGFGAVGSDEIMEAEHAAPITREDMISAGGCYELIGRFSYIENYHPLDQETILNIIKKACEDIADQFHCDINLEEEAMAELFESANSKFGCRLIESKIREVVLKAYSEAMQKDSAWDVMDLNIDTLNSYTFGFREYTEEEMELEEAFQSGGVHKEIPVPKMSFEERMEALIRAQTQQD